MNPEILEKLKGVFTPVAEKIGQGAEFGYTVVVRQQYVEGALGLFWFLVGAITLYVLWRKVMPKLYAWEQKGGPYEERAIPLYLVGIFGTIGGVSALTAGAIQAITHFLNPHFYAIKFFIDLVK